MPIWMMLEECLLICRHYESLQWHINTVRPTGEIKVMDDLASNAQNQNSEVVIIQEGLSNLYIQIDQRMNVLHVELYTKMGSALHHLLFVSNATNKAITQDSVGLSLPQPYLIPIGIQGDHGTAVVEATEVVEAVDPNVLYMKLKHLILQNL